MKDGGQVCLLLTGSWASQRLRLLSNWMNQSSSLQIDFSYSMQPAGENMIFSIRTLFLHLHFHLKFCLCSERFNDHVDDLLNSLALRFLGHPPGGQNVHTFGVLQLSTPTFVILHFNSPCMIISFLSSSFLNFIPLRGSERRNPHRYLSHGSGSQDTKSVGKTPAHVKRKGWKA